jgi:hypothetical protein
MATTMEVDVVTEAEQDILSTDNLPTPSVLSKYRLAGHFCSIAIKSVLAKCVPGINCKELCQLGDETILSQVTQYPRILRLIGRLQKYTCRMREESRNRLQLMSTAVFDGIHLFPTKTDTFLWKGTLLPCH